MGASIERNYQQRPAGALPGEDATGRSALLIAICTGVLMTRMVLGNSVLTARRPSDWSPTCGQPSTRSPCHPA
jgi:hypothetical protein